MPKYRVRLSDGRIVTVQADQPPTEEQILAAIGPRQPKPQPEVKAPAAPAGGMLPTAGAFGGSLLGTIGGLPGRVAGAAAGGALGKGAEMLLDDKDQSIRDGLGEMGMAAATQGGMELAGGMIGKGLKAGATKLADVALNPIESVARKYPNIAETFIQEGRLFNGLRKRVGLSAGVGPVGTKAAVADAGRLQGQSRVASDTMLAAADAAGAPKIQTRKVLGELRPILRDAATDVRTGKADVRPVVVARARALTQRTPEASLSEANVLRRRLDDSADKAFEAARKGQPVNATEASVDKAIATGLRKRVREGAEAAGQTGYQAATQRTRDLAGLRKALDKASTRKHLLTRNMGLTAAGVGAVNAVAAGDPYEGAGAGLGTLGAAYLLTNPRNLGRTALGMDAIGSAAPWVPNVSRALLLSQLLNDSEAEAPQSR